MVARASSARRTLVIGDVHGCLDELRALVEHAGVTADDDVVFVGDLVAKGPDSAGVIGWARERGAAAVLGNHDDHVLKARAGDGAAKKHHLAVAATLSKADVDWLAALPLWLRLAYDEPHVVVHGGMVPGVPVEKQTREHLLAMRSITADGKPSKRIEGAPWGALWAGPEHAVFGHDAIRGLQQHAHATGLDTGCVYGRELTGLLLPAQKLVSVPSRRAYAPMK
jgi:diadenosine tetraphosphatase ApaH/serine/threonine PP2A family protein phosphatase